VRDPKLLAQRQLVDRLRLLGRQIQRIRGEIDFAELSGQGRKTAHAKLTQAFGQLHQTAKSLADAAPRQPRLTTEMTKLAALPVSESDANIAAVTQLIRVAEDVVQRALAATDLTLYQADAQVRSACDTLANSSRLDRVEMALTRPQTGLLWQFPAAVPQFGFAFGDIVQPLALRGGGQPVRQLLIGADAPESDITGAIRNATERLGGTPMRAIVLFTDGQQVGGDSTVESAMAAAGVPIFAINCDSSDQVRDVSVAAVSVPARCFVGETLTPRVTLHSTQPTNITVPISMKIDDQPPTTRPTVLQDRSVTQQFEAKFDQPGVHQLVFSIPDQPDQPTADNKHATRWVQVLSDKVNVGLFSGSVGWDYQYVRNALSRTPWVKLTDAVISGESATPAKLELTPQQILDLDLLMLFDVPTNALSDAQWEAVYKRTADRGGSTIMVAGDSYLPQAWAGAQTTSGQRLAAGLLPFASSQPPVWRNWPGKTAGFHLTVAPDAQMLDALRLDDASQDAAQQWPTLPGIYRFLDFPPLKPTAHPLLIEQDSSSPVLVESRLGLGRILMLGITETWRWRDRVGEKIQDRFWLQLVRYAADEPYARHKGGLSLDASLISAKPHQPVRIRARVQSADGSPLPADRVPAEILKDSQIFRSLILPSSGPVGLGRYAAMVDNLPAGDYQIRLGDPAGADAITLPLHVAPDFEAEMADISGNPQLLHRLAEASGGAYLALSDIHLLPDLIEKAESASKGVMESPLWDSHYLFLFVLGCLAAEWAIRKRLGLI